MEKDSVWIPLTPPKMIHDSSDHNSDASLTSGQRLGSLDSTTEYLEKNGMDETNEAVLGVPASDSKTAAQVEHDTSCVQEESVKVKECDDKKADGIATPAKTNDSNKRRNNGIDLNKKPSQRRRMKKHRPKIYDDSKPKKIPKAQTQTPRTSTSKPKRTPKPATPKQVQEKRKYSRKNKFTGSNNCVQSSSSHGLEQAASTTSIVDVKSCKRLLTFNHMSKSHEEESSSSLKFNLGAFDCFSKIVTSKRNTPRKSRFPKESETRVGKFGNVYQRRKKNTSNTTNNNISTLKVYGRKFKENSCLQNSKKSGPNFPRMFKKLRSKRKKATVNKNWWFIKAVEDVKITIKKSNRKLTETTKEKVAMKLDLQMEEFFLRVFSPARRKRSIRQIRRRSSNGRIENSQKLPNKKCVLQKEENCVPLQEVPVHRIESFSSQHRDFGGVDNCVENQSLVPTHQLHEVPVVESQSLVPTHQQILSSEQDLKEIYISGMVEHLRWRIMNLNINGPCKELVVRNSNVSGPLVKIDPPKKRKVLPKVELDDETLRVWKLLMENDGSEPVEETDKDREEWWERQRKIFRGRVDSFIAKMHLIQGNRRFSPWKGSVVDSVVGVYLTQNVSDHLSSSAFMNLAARFPVKSNSKQVNETIIEIASSQESVTKDDQDFSNNNEIEQNTATPCVDGIDENPNSDPYLVQETPCVTEIPSTFRELLNIEEADFLNKFISHDHNETSATICDVNVSLCEKEVVVESNGGDDECLNHVENEFAVEQKAALEEDPKVVAPVCSLESEVTIEQGVDAINNSLKVMPLEDPRSTGKKKSKADEKQEIKIDWEELRRSYCKSEGRERNVNHMDAVDWDAVRRASVKEVAETIVERGMNNVLAARIKEFLERMVKDHGAIDLEWLRDVPPDKAKEFLLSIQGIGLKSVECVRLLTLHHLAFPVDTNVGRVATRLGWVPLLPLPENVQIHLLNAYPMVDTIQKYLFPRLCTLDQRTLYELHYQLITFGKVFCTKKSPNCNACPMRAECRHYASAFASARLCLTGSKESSNVTSIVPTTNEQNHSVLDADNPGSSYAAQNCEPIIEVPPSPEPEVEEALPDIEDYFCESDDEIPIIRLNTEEFKETLKDTIDANRISVPDADVSKALVALSAEAASYRPRPMKFIAKLRTVHLVYELPDYHPILNGFDEREHDDPTPYLLAIWLPDETKSLEYTPCDSCVNNQDDTIKASVLIPCRTANRGKFPLNGTYFQVNEVFADDETSKIPMDVPRNLLWNLPRRELGCGTSATSIFKALSTGDIQRYFWRGSICVRGFNRQTRQPRPLHRRFHYSTTAIAADNKKVGKR